MSFGQILKNFFISCETFLKLGASDPRDLHWPDAEEVFHITHSCSMCVMSMQCYLLQRRFFFLSIQIKLLFMSAFDPDDKHSVPSTAQIYQNVCVCFREDVASSSTFTLEDSAICLTSEQSTMDVDIDRDDGSVLDVYLVSWFSISEEKSSGLLIKSC